MPSKNTERKLEERNFCHWALCSALSNWEKHINLYETSWKKMIMNEIMKVK